MTDNGIKYTELVIIIVSYNIEHYLGKCLLSLKEKLSDLSYRIILVDNASRDNSVVIAKNICSECIIIETGANLGFGKAVNIATRAFPAQRYLILNPDTEITNDIIQKMMFHMDSYPNAGIVGCRMVSEDGSIQHQVHSFPGLLVAISHLLQLKRLIFNKYFKYAVKCFQWITPINEYINYKDEMTSWINVAVVPGSCFLVDGILFHEVGGFDENIFLYYEDVDLFYRISKHKKKEIHLLPDIGIIHYYGKSFNSEFTNISPYKYWSMLYYYKKNHGIKAYYLISFFLLLTTVIKYLTSFFRNFNGDLEQKKYLRDCMRIVKISLLGLSSFDPFMNSPKNNGEGPASA